jgi:hypothetical protein
MMKIKIAIENGQSFKLCQTRQVDVSSLVHYKHTTELTTNEVTGPLTELQGGLGVDREEKGVGGKKRRSRGMPGEHNQHHLTHPPSPLSELAQEGVP